MEVGLEIESGFDEEYLHGDIDVGVGKGDSLRAVNASTLAEAVVLCVGGAEIAVGRGAVRIEEIAIGTRVAMVGTDPKDLEIS